MLWIICAALAIIVGFAIFMPFLRPRASGAEPTAAYDLRVYRDQLREVERDLERGVLDGQDAARLRIEIGRKVLDADRQVKAAARAGEGPGVIWGVLGVAIITGGAFALYTRIGAPTLPDVPIAGRIALAEERYASRPTQAEAEAQAPKLAPPAADEDYLKLIGQLRSAMKERPDDPQGLALLADHESRLGNFVAAKTAQAHLISVLGDKATAEDHARLAAFMVEAAAGLITSEAEAEIVAALKIDPKNGQARYMAGLLQIQNGRPDRAFPIWAALLAEGPADAPWNAPIRPLIMDLAWLAGEPSYTIPDTSTLPGPDADAVAAANDMTPEERQQMIASMVEGLENRLANQGGTPEEWARLISSLVVVDRADHARAIWQEAQSRFANAPEALAIVNAAAGKAGLVQ